ncbi:MAG: inorganic phosphate transporter [Bacteroidales bacterium]|jgi:phosphate/sulfate permease|nr:inorganic phosphate transporter [Bacteroidales bacterium]
MDQVYIILVGVLLLFAVFDLMVGVSNDASNFLNSAIGSKVASYRTIMIVACLGIVLGATFSSGMMDIARNGIFNPSKFYFNEIMWIFVGVMISDVILLDIFNGLGLPTSTTVSIIFDLLGASLAMAIFKLTQAGEGYAALGEYINTAKALAIISGILISVVVAFVSGSLIQWVVRFIFTFNYRKTYKYFGSLFGGIAITSIIYFMIMKGAKGASFMKPEYLEWINTHNWQLLIGNFVLWTIILQLLMWAFKTNVLKIVILVGTFALAMAFAGNDLVNFIGVPLAGLESYKVYASSGVADNSLVMSSLNEAVKTPTIFLLIAGLIMAVTLAFSRRARKVIDTTINLSRQDTAGEEQFDSTLLARTLVRGTLNASGFFERIVPKRWQKKIDRRFQKRRSDEDVAFDQVRASVNLVVASILIASATSLKLPLSTTYVTFMVAMGSSLADRAWDRETAVYRITGVITVIGGWFITAISALTLSCIITSLLIWGKWVTFSIFVAIVLYFMFRSLFLSERKAKEQEKENKKKKDVGLLNAKSVTSSRVFESSNEQIVSMTIAASKLYYLILSNFLDNKRKALKGMSDEVHDLNKHTKDLRNNVYKVIAKLQGDALESSQFYVQVADSSREIANSILFIYKPAFEYLDNNHSPFIPVQMKELTELNDEMAIFFNMILHVLKNRRYDDLEDIRKKKVVILNLIDNLQKKQLKRIKKQEVSTRNSVLYLNILTETKNIVLFAVSLVKSNRNFYRSSGK